MAFLSASVAEQLTTPSGVWEWFILKVFDFIGSYGWRLILFIVCLKIVLLPLDLFQRFKMRKNQLISERIKPQMEKLQEQYGHDKQLFAQKQMELNKKEGFSYFSSCLPMIVTLVIFFWLFAGLRNISEYMNLKQYLELYDAYHVVYDVETGEGSEYATLILSEPKQEDFGTEAEYTAQYLEWQNQVTTLTNDIKLRSQQAAVEQYEKKSKESFLWISNIWSPDVPWTDAVGDSGAFKTNVNDYRKYSKVSKILKKNPETGVKLTASEYEAIIGEYNEVTRLLRKSDSNRVNGYLILPILSVGLSFLSQFLTTRIQKKSGQINANAGPTMKVMMIVMPIMMGVFAISYTSAFTLYIVINSLTSIITNVVTTLAMNGKDKHKEKKKTEVIHKYGRPDPNDL